MTTDDTARPLVNAVNVMKSFHGTEVLKGLDFDVKPVDGDPAKTRLVQTARFRPRGLAGLLYWYLVLPFHKPVFDGLIDGIRAAAVTSASEVPNRSR